MSFPAYRPIWLRLEYCGLFGFLHPRAKSCRKHSVGLRRSDIMTDSPNYAVIRKREAVRARPHFRTSVGWRGSYKDMNGVYMRARFTSLDKLEPQGTINHSREHRLDSTAGEKLHRSQVSLNSFHCCRVLTWKRVVRLKRTLLCLCSSSSCLYSYTVPLGTTTVQFSVYNNSSSCVRYACLCFGHSLRQNKLRLPRS